MEQIIAAILGLDGGLAYLIIGLLAFGEAAALIGLFVPGELAVLLGGVLAAQGRVSLPAILAVAAVGAVAGDSAGYELGRRWGRPLLASRLMRRHADSVAEAQVYLRRRGGLMVFVGRWTSVLRALVPALAGMSRMPYRRFFAFNVLGGVAWAAAFTLAGYTAGASFRLIDAATGVGSWIVVGALAVWLAARWGLRRRIKRRRRAAARPGGTDSGDRDAEQPRGAAA